MEVGAAWSTCRVDDLIQKEMFKGVEIPGDVWKDTKVASSENNM